MTPAGAGGPLPRLRPAPPAARPGARVCARGARRIGACGWRHARAPRPPRLLRASGPGGKHLQVGSPSNPPLPAPGERERIRGGSRRCERKASAVGATVSGGSAQACAGLDEGGDCLLPSWQKMSGARPGDGASRAGRSDTPHARSSRPPLASRQSAGRRGHLPWEGEAPCEAQRWPSGWWRRPPAAGTAPCRLGA